VSSSVGGLGLGGAASGTSIRFAFGSFLMMGDGVGDSLEVVSLCGDGDLIA